MAKYIVAKADELSPGQRKLVEVGGRPVVIFNIEGEYFAMLNRCPHQGAPLYHGHLTGLVTCTGIGEFAMEREGEIVMCPNHGWEFDIRTGQSWFDPQKTRVRTYASEVCPGRACIEGPYKAEVFPIELDENYLVVTA